MTRFYASAAVTALLWALPASADTFTLNDALGLAYETNPQLESARAAVRASDEGVAQANANWRPTINAGGTYGPEDTRISGFGTIPTQQLSGQVVVTEQIFRGGRTYAEVGRAKASVRAARAQLTAAEQSVLLDAVTAYMNVVTDEATLKLRQSNVDVLERQRKETQEQFDVGELTRTDVAQSEARLAGAKSAFITAQGQLDIDRATYEQVIGRPAETLQDQPPLPKLPPNEELVTSVAMQQNPSMVFAQANEKAAGYAVDDAIGALAPTISVAGEYQYQKGGLNSLGFGGPSTTEQNLAVLGQVNVPLYEGGAEYAAVRQAKEQHNQSQHDLAAADRQVRQAVASAWQSYTSAVATITSNQAQVKANQIAFDGVQKEQQVGGRTTLDVLNAEEELLDSEVGVIASQRNAAIAAYQLLAAEGGLTAKSLALPVKIYDPLEHYDSDASRWIGIGDWSDW
jgi:outer membrane protein